VRVWGRKKLFTFSGWTADVHPVGLECEHRMKNENENISDLRYALWDSRACGNAGPQSRGGRRDIRADGCGSARVNPSRSEQIRVIPSGYVAERGGGEDCFISSDSSDSSRSFSGIFGWADSVASSRGCWIWLDRFCPYLKNFQDFVNNFPAVNCCRKTVSSVVFAPNGTRRNNRPGRPVAHPHYGRPLECKGRNPGVSPGKLAGFVLSVFSGYAQETIGLRLC
jgi:hypothetical protein